LFYRGLFVFLCEYVTLSVKYSCAHFSMIMWSTSHYPRLMHYMKRAVKPEGDVEDEKGIEFIYSDDSTLVMTEGLGLRSSQHCKGRRRCSA
jgi:hypothetical protein